VVLKFLGGRLFRKSTYDEWIFLGTSVDFTVKPGHGHGGRERAKGEGWSRGGGGRQLGIGGEREGGDSVLTWMKAQARRRGRGKGRDWRIGGLR
jgi:hypothetical protein